MGHLQRDCPDIWRRFHLTLEGDSPMKPASSSSNKHPAAVWCCNCGRQGHLADECRRFAYSPYPPTSLRVIRYATTRQSLFVNQMDDNVNVQLSRRQAEKAAAKAERRQLKRRQFRTCPSSPGLESSPAAKRFRSEANSPPAESNPAPDFIR